MSNKSGASSQVISLPKGGGALQGIGETFSPDLFTGTGNFTVPIALPPGRNGFQPELNLVYSTGNGNGPFGMGWGLSVPGVSRKTSKGIPRYDDDRDVFILSGAEDLVPVAEHRFETETERRISIQYRPRTEGLFARIQHHRVVHLPKGPVRDYWEVRSKDGLVSYYGTPKLPANADGGWQDPGVVANPDDRSKIFSWSLVQTRDPFGNAIVYEYERDDGQDGPHRWDRLYLKRIRYADYGDPPAEPKFLVSVTFEYADRPDPFSEYRAGFEIRTRKRCQDIVVCTHADLDYTVTVRRYRFVYLDRHHDLENLAARLPLNGGSLLSQIWVKGEDNTVQNLLQNSDFETVGPRGASTSFTGRRSGGSSAADGWGVWNNNTAKTSTKLLPSTFPEGGPRMLWVSTTGKTNGLFQRLLRQDAFPKKVTAGAWVYVLRGRVGIGTGNGSRTQLDAFSSTTHQWEYLQAPNGGGPVNLFILYGASAGGAEFYVAEASVSTSPMAEWLPPLEVSYTTFEPESRDFIPIAGDNLPARSLGNPELELADLFGNGLQDILEMNGSVRYWRNLGNGKFDPPRPMREAPAGLQLADRGVQLIDADGDGRVDLLVTQPGRAGYFPLQFGGLWNAKSFQSYRTAPSFDLQAPNVQLVDLTGNGVTDAIRSGSRLECFFNDSKEGWKETRWVERQAIEDFPNIDFSDPRVKWGDMSGDGLQDIVLVYDGNIEYWPNLGYGNWGKRISMRNSPRFRYGYDPRRILIGDVDGDGLADVVYVDDTQTILWINQSGNGWSDPIIIKGTPPVTDTDAVRLVDLLGTGISGVLWSADANGLSRSHMYFLDFTGGVKPYLLHQIDNHMGSITRVQYEPSTRFYLEDLQQRETRWKTPLPFPVQVVSRVEAIDEISHGKLTTEYRYHHGYWDGIEREFRGFGRVEQLDTETFEVYDRAGLHGEDTVFEPVDWQHFSPPTLTKTWFHQGPVMDEEGDWAETYYREEYWSEDPSLLERPKETEELLEKLSRPARRDALRTLRGQMLRTELYALDGTSRQSQPYTVTEAQSGVVEVEPPTDPRSKRQRIFFPHGLAQRITQWERGDEPMTQFSFTQDYDDYGQPSTQIQIACPREWRNLDDRPDKPYLATLSKTVYTKPRDDLKLKDDRKPSDNPNPYMVDRMAYTIAYEIVRDGKPTVLELLESALDRLRLIGQSFNYYDPKPEQQFSSSDKLQVIGQSFNYYDGNPFEGMPLGRVGNYGLVTRTEVLIVTSEILEAAYQEKDGVSALPPYFRPDPIVWPGEYPVAFRQEIAALPGTLGYTEYKKIADDPHETGYFVTAYQQYDVQVQDPAVRNSRGLLLASRDALGRETQITYDDYDLLPVKAIDPAHLETEAHYDYRVMQPRQVIDPNGNCSHFTFSPMGLLASTVVMGKPGEQVGDTQKTPGSWLEYDFFSFEKSGQPIWVRTIQREVHYWEAIRDENEKRARNGQPPLTDAEIANLFPAKERELKQFPERFLQAVEYSDGFGRLVQTRTQAEDLTFGDDVFGNGVLPADQGDEAKSKAPVVGRQRLPDDPETVVVSGWQIYDNKGQVVEKYEPFYSQGGNYGVPTDRQRGEKATLFYDPRGQMIRTVNPNGSEQRVIYGRPDNLDNPEQFQPTPWEVYTYDENDNAGRTHESISNGYHHHWNTPSSAVVDALGRTVQTTERNRAKPSGEGDPLAAIEEYRTTSTYDIRGNLLTVRDALGREAFSYTYDLTPSSGEEEEEGAQVWRIEQLDAGVRRMVFDAAGTERERRDSKGAVILQDYDRLDRPRYLWARDGKNEAVSLRERLIYGDGGDVSQLSEAERRASQAQNLLGELQQHYDEAGRQIFGPYDFKGNLRQKQRQTIGDATILKFPAFRVDWQPPAGQTLEQYANGILEARVYGTDMAYDGLNRVMAMTYPEDTNGHRQVLKPNYNWAGALERVSLNGQPYVEQIAYNAKGQRTLIAYGNGLITRYAYEAETFRLARLRTEAFTQQGLTYAFQGAPLQDFAYRYDLAGNILSIQDRTPRCGVQNEPLGANALDRQFTYDPMYRLLSATGRECKDIPKPRPWDDEPRCGFHQKNNGLPDQRNAPELTVLYRETYTYDAAGNMLTLQHQQVVQRNGNSDWETTWSRHFGMGEMTPEDWAQTWQQHLQKYWPDPLGNKLTHVEDRRAGVPAPPVVNQTHFFDDNGNLTREKASRHFEWDHSDRLREFRTQAPNGPTTVRAVYFYDSAGMRVKKLVVKGNQPGAGVVETTTYIDEVFERRQQVQAGATKENSWLHVMDGENRVALVRVGQPLDEKDVGPAVQYCLGDHLGSSNLVVDNSRNWVNREEFTPYGETSFGAFGKKRYRFTGKERDEESGLNYHDARYLGNWLGRWISCDPQRNIEKINSYSYALSNPILYFDSNGRNSEIDNKKLNQQREFLRSILRQIERGTDLPDLPPSTISAQPPLPPWGYIPPPPVPEKEDRSFAEYINREALWKRSIREIKEYYSQQNQSLDYRNFSKVPIKELLRQKTLAERQQQSIVYLRRNPRNGKLYVGRTSGDEFGRFLKRQFEHGNRLGTSFEWRILEVVERSQQRLAEEDWIRRFGGPARYGGRLSNYRYEINDPDYRRQSTAAGRRTVPRPTDNTAAKKSNPPSPPTQQDYQRSRNRSRRARNRARRR
ncbi:MAG: SpvB/TcaC N-terminal domain-containing protein [Synechococcus sp.]